jgi:hypothetical protein
MQIEVTYASEIIHSLGYLNMLIDVAVSGDRNVIKKEAEKLIKYKDLNSRNTAQLECKNKCGICNNRGNWNCQNNLENTQATYQESTKSRNCRKRPYSIQHTYWGKY